MVDSDLAQGEAILLLTLGEVSELVAHSHDLNETLTNIVRHIQRRFRTDVCSVYICDNRAGELVLRATVGLNENSVNRVRMPLHEGLTGLVAERKLPVSVEDAPKHPRFRYFPESGEEQYHSFLGVPLIQGGVFQGVLVIQHREPRRYSANETRLFVGVAAQLAVLVTNARLTSDLAEAVRQQQDPGVRPPPIQHRPRELTGTSACAGIGQGRALRFEEFDFADPKLVLRPAGSAEDEKARLALALERGRLDIDAAARHLAELLGDQFGALMQAQRLMLEDSSVQRDLDDLINSGRSVEQAVVTVCERYLRAFQRLDNPLFYERIYDIKDVFRRVLGHASGNASPSSPGEQVIVVASEVSLLELFSCDLSRVRGVIVEKGGAFSHVAILARSLGIPMLTNVYPLLAYVQDGDQILIDAHRGQALLNPDSAEQASRFAQWQQPSTNGKIVDNDAVPIRLETTVNLLPEIARTVEHNGTAVGLFRSEFLELARRSFPSEEEQLDVYRTMIRMLRGRPLTIRTLDLRPDKLFGITADPKFRVELWDWRLVDQLPHVQDLLRGQLRAILRAAVDGPVRLLFPMITTQRQFQCALDLLSESRKQLVDEGLPMGDHVPVGIMIEVPAAAMMIRHWVNKVDFVCVGSNDLLHSLLGIDREDDRLLRLKTPLTPGYLKTVWHVIKHARAAGRPTTVCGEAASNPRAALALYALGADALSVPPDDLPRVRQVFSEIVAPADPSEARRRLLRSNDVEEVESVLERFFPLKAPLVNGTGAH